MHFHAQLVGSPRRHITRPDMGGAAAVAPTPNTIDRAALVEIVRRGGTLHGQQQAKPYANSAGQTGGLDNFKRETDIRLRGFFCVKLGRCQLPVACTYNFFPFFPDEGECTYCDDFYCFPTCLPVPMLVPVPGCGCCAPRSRGCAGGPRR